MAIRQITIVGTGLIGGSFGLALKRRRFPGRIVGCDRDPVLERARNCGAIDDGYSDLGGSVVGSQVVILAPPGLSIIDLIHRSRPALPLSPLLTSLVSTKAAHPQ